MINHRWRNTYYYTIFYGILACIVAMIWMITQMPKEFKGGALAMYNELGQREQTDIYKLRQELNKDITHQIVELRESIKEKCLIYKN